MTLNPTLREQLVTLIDRSVEPLDLNDISGATRPSGRVRRRQTHHRSVVLGFAAVMGLVGSALLVDRFLARPTDAPVAVISEPRTVKTESRPVGPVSWRLLGAIDSFGSPVGVSVTTDQNSYWELWQSSGMAGSPPEVDFASEVVFRFVTRSLFYPCEVNVAGLIVDFEQSLVTPKLQRYNYLVNGKGPDCVFLPIERDSFVSAKYDALPDRPFSAALREWDLDCDTLGHIECETQAQNNPMVIVPA